jgi:hypothetical protein
MTTQQNKKLLSWVRKTYPTQYQQKSLEIDELIKSYSDWSGGVKEVKCEIEKLIIKS